MSNELIIFACLFIKQKKLFRTFDFLNQHRLHLLKSLLSLQISEANCGFNAKRRKQYSVFLLALN